MDDIQTVYFSERDVVRHRLVQDIVKAYEKSEERKITNNINWVERRTGKTNLYGQRAKIERMKIGGRKD